MRIAAGILLIIVGAVVLVGMIIEIIGLMGDFDVHSAFVSILFVSVSPRIIFCGLLVAGGVLCLKRRHWGVCLVSALITLSLWILPAVAPLAGGDFSIMMWHGWIVVIGTLISTIFISLRKKEWQEVSDSVDGKVSYGG
jgi:hypothetical protein